VPSLGPARFLQAAGFLKITGGENPLDCTWIHPESYGVAERLLTDLGYSPAVLEDKPKTEELRERLKSLTAQEICPRLEVGLPTLRDILEALARPGRDPREDLPPPVFKKGILRIEDLMPGMELKGTVLNVVDFGAFVDIGLKDSGLVHISQMANRFIKNPYDVVAVGDVVKVWVMAVDQERRRVSLTMIKPGTERKPIEKSSPQEGMPKGGKRPPRGRRPPPRHGQGAIPGQPPARTALAAEGSAVVSAQAVAASAENMVVAPPAGRESPPPPAPRPAPHPRKPHRHPPKAKLTKAALEGDSPLRTFGELKAFFEAKGKDAVPGRPDSSREKSAENKEQGSGNP
jgi:uncharacterized protein